MSGRQGAYTEYSTILEGEDWSRCCTGGKKKPLKAAKKQGGGEMTEVNTRLTTSYIIINK